LILLEALEMPEAAFNVACIVLVLLTPLTPFFFG